MVSFRFNDVPAKIRDWWLVMTAEEVDVCDFDPGYDVAVSVTGSLRRMVEIWRGDLGWPARHPLRNNSARRARAFDVPCRSGSRLRNSPRYVGQRLI